MNSTAIEWEAASGSSRSHGDVCNESFVTQKEATWKRFSRSRAWPREELRDAEIESAATWCSPLHPTA